MTDKIRVLKASIVAQDSKNVAYTDAGGTLRKAPVARVEIVDSMDDKPQVTNDEAVASMPESGPESSSAATGVTEVPPPPSDKPPAEESAPVQTKPRPQRKKQTMATAQTSTAAKKKVAPPAKAKVAAKKAAPPKPRTESTGVRTIGGKAVNLDGYEKVKTPAGGTSYHNGDPVAEKLVGKTLDEVYAFASKTLKEDEKTLRTKYKHLNLGMQRMSLGNRIRKVLIPKAAK